MTLNCRLGDLARIIVNESWLENIRDKIVCCDRLTDCGKAWFLKEPLLVKSKYTGLLYIMSNRKSTYVNKGDVIKILTINDKALRPIRDEPGQDESLLWAPVPNKHLTLELEGF